MGLFSGFGGFLNPNPFSSKGGSIHDPLDIFGFGAKNYNSAEAQKARDFNAAEAQKQRDWEERMSNTAVQRRSEDLEKAGLNRTLAATDGATVGGAAAATGPAASDPGNNASGLIGAFMQALTLRNDMEKFDKGLQEQKRVNSAEIAKKNAEKLKALTEAKNIKEVNPHDSGAVKTIKYGFNQATNSAQAYKRFKTSFGSALSSESKEFIKRGNEAQKDWEFVQKHKNDEHPFLKRQVEKRKKKWGWK